MLHSWNRLIRRLIISAFLSAPFVAFSTQAIQKCTIPSIDLIGRKGNPVPLSRYSGKVIIFAFWTTWCTPCRASELPGLATLRKEIRNDDLIIVAINNDAVRKEAQRYLDHPAIDFGALESNVFFDSNYRVYHTLIGKNSAEIHPYAVIFDHNGCITETFVGPHDWLSEPTVDLIKGLLTHSKKAGDRQ